MRKVNNDFYQYVCRVIFLLAFSASHLNNAWSFEISPILSIYTQSGSKTQASKSLMNQFGTEYSESESISNDPINSRCKIDRQRQSYAFASASSQIKFFEKNATTISLNVHAKSQGGHFRSYTLPELCFGISGNDTSGIAEADSEVTVGLEFTDLSKDMNYFIRVSRSNDKNLNISLRDPSGKDIPLNESNQYQTILRGNPGDIYYLKASIFAKSSTSGECESCTNDINLSSQIDIRIYPVPLIFSGEKIGYVANGIETIDYPTVGVIRLENDGTHNKMLAHCTGTIIGPHTILTAAHCLVNTYIKDIQQMDFGIGPSANSLISGPYKLTGFCYPTNKNYEEKFASGFCDSASQTKYLEFNPNTYEDDIALVFTEQELPEDGSKLYAGNPKWKDLASNKDITFVGYGFNSYDGKSKPFDIGIKRTANFPTEKISIENKKLKFPVENKTLCKGDSGGPSFIENANKLPVVIGITSNGYKDCTAAEQTKVDYYVEWIERLRH
ncbi:trypsin-like serine protease [Methylomonas methanica]|nr:trypsin-like serine protease [Methylomonas methanica]